MKVKFKAAEKKKVFDQSVKECRDLASKYIKGWKAINKKWETIEGVAYIRVSDSKQVLVDKGSLVQQVNIAAQEAITRSHQESINYKIVSYAIEPGFSGTTAQRPALQRMCWELKKRKYEFIMVRELSRLMRDQKFWLDFFEICKESQCEIIVRGRTYNMNNPTDVKQLDSMAQAAAHESLLIGERTKDTNHSAAKYHGKLNATKLILGLDQKLENNKPVVGRFTVNKEEVRTVEWIMRTFIKFGSYTETLKEINKRNILNKGGTAFTKSSLRTLLKSKKYIGKWVLNEKNKHKKQEKLMPYDRYEVINLPHGRVVDQDLWDQVQKVAESVRRQNDKNDTRCFVLSGLLVCDKDKSTFHGDGKKYYNKSQNIRIAADLVEAQASKITKEIIENSPKLQNALRKAISENKVNTDLLDREITKLKSELVECKTEKTRLDKRLDFFLASPDQSKAEAFRESYFRDLSVLDKKIDEVELVITRMEQNKAKLDSGPMDMKSVSQKACAILNLLERGSREERAALKNLYRSLFKAVWVSDKSSVGSRDLFFELKTEEIPDDYRDFQVCGVSGKKIGDRVEMGWPMGLEPTTTRITIWRSTN